MHTLRRSIVRKLGGFAALCAILLLSCVPLASQSFAHEGFIAPICASGPQQHHASKNDALTHLNACAYCDFVAHAPTPPVVPRADANVTASSESFDKAISIDVPCSVTRTHAQSRAPPAFA
ncbi:DUF2946 family protein [Caballeronia sp. BR00000012568055]|uniref:DUF2946 family protein n=1 Tax=Caballeronia sp. BR00000012568055 TaxID=2918761 RepID=UPI0023F90D81|nr:DUF2946 family protein [Caballeronia sp. BR00000012568055]